jgi:hypothetical protein
MSKYNGFVVVKAPAIDQAMRKAGLLGFQSCQLVNSAFIAVVDLTKVVIDDRFNPRKVDWKHIEKIWPDFNTKYSELVKVILRKEKGKWVLYTSNGNHTRELLMRAGHKIVTVLVYVNPTVEEAANIFLTAAVNTKKIPCWDAHRSAVIAHKPAALKIQRELRKAGLQLPTRDKKCNCGAYAPIEEAAKSTIRKNALGDLLAFSQSFKLPNGKWETKAGKCYNMRAMIDFLNRHYNTDVAVFIEAFRGQSMEEIEGIAKDIAEHTESRIDRSHIARALEYFWSKIQAKAA